MEQENILVQKYNATFDKLLADAGILKELDEYLTFKAPNYFYHPLFKRNLWDGNIRIFKLRERLLYCGLHDKVEEFCSTRNYNVIYEENLGNKSFTEKEAQEFIESLKLPYKLYDHQFYAFYHAIREGRCLVISPTSSGKTLVMYLVMKYYNCKTLIIVPSIGLIKQTVANFTFFGHDPDDIYTIYEGKEKNSNKSCVISTWQSLQNEKDLYYTQYKCIIMDEVHSAAAKEMKGIMERATQVYNRFGFTGTLTESKTNELIIRGLFGKIIKTTSNKELMNKGVSSPLEIHTVVLKYPDTICKIHKKDSYTDELKFLVSYEERNEYIAKLACSIKGNTIIFFRFKEHGNNLFKLIKEKTNKKVFHIDGTVDIDTREDIRLQIENEDSAIIVASYGTSSTGIDISKIHNIIFASPYKAIVKVLQSIGRGLRLHETKNKCILFDIADNMMYNKHLNHTYKHFLSRLKIYIKEEFKYKVYNINLMKGK